LERELKIKIDADTKEELRQSVADVDSYKEKVKRLLETLREKNEGKYKLLKQIDHLIPLYDAHDFWDSQPVPKAYDKVDMSLMDKPIDAIKTVADVKQVPYNLPQGFVWADVDITDNEQAKEVYDLLT
jgi:hypothetical protein